MLSSALYPGDMEGKGQQWCGIPMNVTCTVALCDHVTGFFSVACCICTDNMWPVGLVSAPGTANSGMETQHYPQGAPEPFLSPQTHGGRDD